MYWPQETGSHHVQKYGDVCTISTTLYLDGYLEKVYIQASEMNLDFFFKKQQSSLSNQNLYHLFIVLNI